MNLRKTLMYTVLSLTAVCLIISQVIAQKIETIDGVRVVHNEKKGAWGNNPKVNLKFETLIGSLEAVDENYSFYMPVDVYRDDQGNVYVLDSGNHRIQKFDISGKYLATYGDEGQGPAEFMRPLSLDVDADGVMYVSDRDNRRIQVLTPNGRNKETIPFDGSVGPFRRFSDGAMLMGQGGLLMMGPGMMDDPKPPPLLQVYDINGEQVKEIGEPRDYKDFLMNRMGNQSFFTIDKDDNVFVALRFQNRIDKYSADGKMLLRIDRHINIEETKGKSGSMDVGPGMQRIEMPQMNQISAAIDVDNTGRIWVITADRKMREDEQVQRNIEVRMDASGRRSTSERILGATDITKTDMYKLEVFTPDGIFLGTIPITHFCDHMRIFGDTLYIIDEVRGMQVYIYTIEEK